jgi:hypothetical protein
MNLEDLALFAVKNNNAPGSTPMYELDMEEARYRVNVKDGNRVPKIDGSRSLTLTIGKIVMALDVIKPRATRINATKEQADAFTETLYAAVEAGKFDDAILEAQAKARASAEKRGEAPVANSVNAADVDLDALEDELETEAA